MKNLCVLLFCSAVFVNALPLTTNSEENSTPDTYRRLSITSSFSTLQTDDDAPFIDPRIGVEFRIPVVNQRMNINVGLENSFANFFYKEKMYLYTDKIYSSNVDFEPTLRGIEKWGFKGTRLYLYISPEFQLNKFLFSSEVAIAFDLLKYTYNTEIYYPDPYPSVFSDGVEWENRTQKFTEILGPFFRWGIGYQFRLFDIHALFGEDYYVNLKLRWKLRAR